MMEKETNCSGDASTSSAATSKVTEFTLVDRMRFTSLTYEVMEELKMRRDLDVENERKIRKLLNDRFALGSKLEQEQTEINHLKQQHTAEMRESRRQCEDKLREMKIETAQCQVYKKLVDREKDGLKEEIRKLQMTNYSLEKKVRETERQEKIQANEREQYIQQVLTFECQYKGLLEEVKKLTEKQHKLDKDCELILFDTCMSLVS